MKKFSRHGGFPLSGMALLAIVTIGFGSLIQTARTHAEEPAGPQPVQSNAHEDVAQATRQASDSLDVTVFTDGFAQVEETRQVKLHAGHNRIQLTGIAAKYRQDSLFIVDVQGPVGFKYGSATYAPAMDKDRILSQSIGETVTAIVGAGANAHEVSGKLRAVEGGQAIITTPGGSVVITGTGEITLPRLPSGYSSTASLVVEADVATAGDYSLHYVYETQGLGWTANHLLVYDQSASRVDRYQVTVHVVNGCGTTFEKANVWLLSGSVEQNRGPRFRVQSAQYAPGSARLDAVGESAAVQSVGEKKVYRIPGTVTLVDNQTRQIPLVAGKNIPVEHEYYVGAGGYPQGGDPSPVNVRLRLKNCTEHNLGTPLPAGEVKVYQRNNESKLQLTANTDTHEVAINEQFELEIGTSSDVKAQRTLTKQTQAPVPPGVAPRNGQEPEFVDRTYEVKVSNHKQDKAVDVVVEAVVPPDQEDIKPFVRKNAGLATTTVHVDADKTSTLTYTVRVRTR